MDKNLSNNQEFYALRLVNSNKEFKNYILKFVNNYEFFYTPNTYILSSKKIVYSENSILKIFFDIINNKEQLLLILNEYVNFLPNLDKISSQDGTYFELKKNLNKLYQIKIDTSFLKMISDEFIEIFSNFNRRIFDLQNCINHHNNLENKTNLTYTSDYIDDLKKELQEYDRDVFFKANQFLLKNIENTFDTCLKVMAHSQDYKDYKPLIIPRSKIELNFISHNRISSVYLPPIEFTNINGKFEMEELNDEKLNEIANDFKTKKCFSTIYDITNHEEFFSVYMKYIIDNNIQIKKCKNCGKYFIPHNKQIYCDNISPQNEKYTCRLLPDDMKKNKSPIYETYRNNYKTQSNKKRRNKDNIPDIEEKFSKWNEQARNKMKECESGKITLDEYKLWLKQSQNWIKSQ